MGRVASSGRARRAVAVAIAFLAACGTDPAAPPATVSFLLDAPLCSSSLPVQFSIDAVVVGTDTFRVHLPPDHVASAGFAVGAGTHTLGARVIGGLVWPDTTVTLAPAQAFTRSLPFYCS